ncbi:uncharacterized protein LOC131680645 [Topomyia yanbarensis]|uniref:uncharacterized protein LOC131680645 n=1 Tax=Topomyia yanbarensis TaxID=2498891 RepID=UPI00273AACC9|nr:uncharacterized protein LOC131680645 [Topomyia yanbarensis]
MILELKKDSKSSSCTYKELTEKAIGEAVKVRALCPEATIQCKDLDEISSEEELREALEKQCELGEVQMMIRMRKGPFGTQAASVRLPVEAANKALKIGKIKVGWSVCPLSVSQQPEVCFKCQEFGHLARNCSGPDRSKLCRRCGEEGHMAKDCRQAPRCLICATEEGDCNKITVEVTQINLNHCDTAQHLLRQSVAESKCDIATISEPYRIPASDGHWIADNAKSAAIWTTGRYPFQEVVYRADEGFKCSTEELIDRRPVVIAGDFNAWAVEWGSRFTNSRGSSLLEAFAKLNIDVANDGTASTFRRDGRNSVIYDTFCSPGLVGSLNWRVCVGYTHSDHQAIRYTIGSSRQSEARMIQSNERRWKTTKFDKGVFVEALRRECNHSDFSADEVTTALARACDATMPREGKPRYTRCPAFWRNSAFADLRACCHRALRKMQRTRNVAERDALRPAYKAARAALNKEIKLSKKA